jgi:hypothetical protein
MLNGPVGLLGRHASPWAASCRLISCRAGPALWAENEAQPNPTSCSCRPGPEKIVLGSCSCRAKKKSCYGLTHGPRAKWPSILAAPLGRSTARMVRGAPVCPFASGSGRPLRRPVAPSPQPSRAPPQRWCRQRESRLRQRLPTTVAVAAIAMASWPGGARVATGGCGWPLQRPQSYSSSSLCAILQICSSLYQS